jgi:MFS superfamily sulfate permease-like transporter
MRGIVGVLFYSVVALAPILAGVFIVSRLFLRRDRLIGLAPLAVVIGFLAGGFVGWAFVPAQWTASFWTTVEAAGNAAKYGEPFEHMAEHALVYFFYPALLGAVAFGVLALVCVWRTPGPPAARALP